MEDCILYSRYHDISIHNIIYAYNCKRDPLSTIWVDQWKWLEAIIALVYTSYSPLT